MLPVSFAIRHSVVPLGHNPDGKLIIATSHKDPKLTDSLSFLIEEPYLLVYKPQNEIAKLHAEIYKNYQVSEPHQSFQTQQPLHLKVFHHFLQQSILQNASDVHLESFSDLFRVRFRVNGNLLLYENLAKKEEHLIVNHIKIISHLSIDTQKKPQNGKFAYTFEEKNYTFRVSIIPSLYGESLVLRLHKSTEDLLNLKQLGFLDHQIQSLKKITKLKQGLILACGSTGSGKTTTLYALIKYLREQKLKVITIEDPVEARIEGVNQVKINHYVDYEIALKSILRQSPDVIMVGEIREAHVAKIALQAALTGHLVIASIHAGNKNEALLRFEEMEIPSEYLNNALKLTITQYFENDNSQRIFNLES